MCRIQSGSAPPRPRNKRRCPLQPAESLLARARAPPAARSDSVDVRARRPSPLLPAGPCSATPPALRLLPCAPLDVGRKDRFPLGTRLREDRARVVNAARARSPFPGTPVAVTWDPRLKTALKQRERRRCSSSRRRSAHRDKLGAPFSPPPPPPPRPSPPSPPPSISRRRPSDGPRAPRSGRSPAPRRCPPLAAAPLVAAASPVNPAVRTTAATASRLAAAATALPLAAERCLASLSPSRSRLPAVVRTACAHSLLLCTLTAPPAPPRMQLGACSSSCLLSALAPPRARGRDVCSEATVGRCPTVLGFFHIDMRGTAGGALLVSACSTRVYRPDQ